MFQAVSEKQYLLIQTLPQFCSSMVSVIWPALISSFFWAHEKQAHGKKILFWQKDQALFRQKKKKLERNCSLGTCLPPTPPPPLPRTSHLVSVKARCFMVSVITAPLTNAPLEKKSVPKARGDITGLPPYGEIRLSTGKKKK